ncbi:DUF1523 family protein [Thioalkalicoccus limnaeus]|uniref:DUF1523 family protein n=1 Tax=Thioalkalicoccus limnaeus TaxID=120681 RepID=A0ABV4BGI9_9GAMM
MKQKLTIALATIVVIALVFAYFRIGPRSWDVQITGVTGDGRAIQYRIETLRSGTTDSLVFRNEDAGFWPPYFKFDSADVQSDASRVARHCPEEAVKVHGYSMRIPLLNMFPNVRFIDAPERCLTASSPASSEEHAVPMSPDRR